MANVQALAGALPVGGKGKHTAGFWGVMTLIVTEGALFGYLLVSYYYLLLQTEAHWPPEGVPKLLWGTVNTGLLLASSGFVWGGEQSLKRGRYGRSLLLLTIAILLGGIFLGIQWHEWRGKPYGLTTNLYGSLYFTITGFHMAHVAVGLVVLLTLLAWVALGYLDHRRYVALSIGGLYWHFVDAVWLVIFSGFYLLPYVV